MNNNEDVRLHLPRPTILYHTDDESTMIEDYLNAQDMDIIKVSSLTALREIRTRTVDLYIFGHFMSTIPGDLKLVTAVRKNSMNVPILMLVDIPGYNYMFEAFDALVDDYMIKPVNLEELVCRIKALLRRNLKPKELEGVYEIGDYRYITDDFLLHYKDGSVERLMPRMGNLLGLLCAYNENVAPKDVILSQLWNDATYFNSRSLDVYICKLRKALSADRRIVIENVRGMGFRLRVKKVTTPLSELY